jgi:hypothetical protein
MPLWNQVLKKFALNSVFVMQQIISCCRIIVESIRDDFSLTDLLILIVRISFKT